MHKKNKNYFILQMIVFAGILLISNNLFAAEETKAAKQKTYVFHTALQTPLKEILTTRIQEAFKRLGLKAEILISDSSQRALILANEEGDGEAFRVTDIKEISPDNTNNLIQVPEPIITTGLSVYSKNLSFPVKGWKCLEKYHNGARFGAKILEKNIPGKTTFVLSTIQLVKMLDSDRIDTMVEWDLVADHVIQQLKAESIKKLSPCIKIQPFHIYLHKKHRELVPKLNKVLVKMKEDGFFGQVKEEYVFYTGAQSPAKEILGRRLKQAFKRAGRKFKLVYTGSAQRALVMANEDGDGDATRVPDIKQIAPKDTENLIQIPESIDTIRFYVYTRGDTFVVKDYNSLSNYRNGFRVGVKLLEKKIPGERIILPDADRLFQMLDDGRLDNVIERVYVADKILRENNYPGIKRLSPALVDLQAYSLIHKKHRALVPKIAEALKEMKADGTFERIEKEALKEFNLN